MTKNMKTRSLSESLVPGAGTRGAPAMIGIVGAIRASVWMPQKEDDDGRR